MKHVLMDGKLLPFDRMDSKQSLTEEVNHNFIGYSNTYYIDGQRFDSPTPLKFYK